jgi:hypothetical protein
MGQLDCPKIRKEKDDDEDEETTAWEADVQN